MIFISNSQAFMLSTSLPESFELKLFYYKSRLGREVHKTYPWKALYREFMSNTVFSKLQKLIPAQIRQLILYINDNKG